MAFHAPESCRVAVGPYRTTYADGNNGVFQVPFKGKGKRRFYTVIASDGMGWEHVSVSLGDRCPTWNEMCFIKSLFWDSDDVVLQFHPKESEYVNKHPFCLHLWRPVCVEVQTPPIWMVG